MRDESVECYKVLRGEANPGECGIGSSNTYEYRDYCPTCKAEGKVKKPEESGNKKKKPDGGSGTNAGVKRSRSGGRGKKCKKEVK